MKILMMTNTYAPMTGGIEESIRSFTAAFERLGHEVMIVAPECDGVPPDEVGVIRLRAIQNFNHSDFSMALPMSGLLPELMKTFMPDIIHSHHPFWMGDIALRLSSQNRVPLVFTYHTMFEHHMHYLPVKSEGAKSFIVELFAGYANLSDQVIVPSESVRTILLQRGVTTPMEVIPTGVNLQKFSQGEGGVIRRRLGIPNDSVVVGYVGRIAQEKNMEFLSRSVAGYLQKESRARFLIAGQGPLEDQVKKIFKEQGLEKRLHWAGLLHGQDLVDFYHAMNVFTFASVSETQGIVLVEAMAAGIPIVAVDAPGVREVVKDGYNGRLIFEENQSDFVKALSWCLDRPAGEFQKMKENAKATTKEFAIDLCAQKMLKTYQDVRAKEYVSHDHKGSAWFALGARLINEWDMFKNMMQAGGAAMTDAPILNSPRQAKPRGLFKKMPRLLSLDEWSVRLLRLPQIEGAETQPGLVLIQIDGLSMSQLKGAFACKRMPFLKGLIEKEYYRLYKHYPGLPSSTPSVQGELLYGIKQIVPAFSFFDRDSHKIFRMYDDEAVLEIERRLAQQGQGLLDGGGSYSNIYSGGAQETHFCATSLGWGRIWKDVNPMSFVLLFMMHFPSFVRMAVLTAWEIVLGVVEFSRGIFNGENFHKAWNFIYLRALICILLRELVALGAKIDIARGLPIIHLNLLGYDELAHNRGPSSSAAYWSLQGIDRAIERIYHAALHSSRRSYDVWIYSDHGQEEAVSYVREYGRSVEEVVAEIFKEFDATVDCAHYFERNGEQLYRAHFLGFSFIKRIFNRINSVPDLPPDKKLLVTAIGPTGNIYLPQEMAEEEKHRFARKLVDNGKIPIVMLPEAEPKVRVWTAKGEFTLPEDAEKIFGKDHPYLKQVTEDLIRVCHHKDAGDFTFMGFRLGAKPITFPDEKGSHAGPGLEETNAFALLPVDIIKVPNEKTHLTPTDLRVAALRLLKRPILTGAKQYPEFSISQKKEAAPDRIRIMTYNTHACVGTDGKISPERIARVIGRHEPDIVALQELDVQRPRTGGIDQPLIIAKQLEMIYHFHPSIQIEGECYGNAMLSRYPMELIRSGSLPSILNTPRVEPRGAIWVVINIAGTKINVFNTHLGYYPREGTLQTQALLCTEWIGHPVCQGPVVLCGDFNALPSSQLCRNIKVVLRDVQAELDNHRPRATWFSRYPIGRVDHIFVGPEIEVTRVEVSRTDLDKIASDHLPLIVDIKIKKSV